MPIVSSSQAISVKGAGVSLGFCGLFLSVLWQPIANRERHIMTINTLREMLRLILITRYSNNRIGEILDCSHNTVSRYRALVVLHNLSESSLSTMDDGQLLRMLTQRQERDPTKREPNWEFISTELRRRNSALTRQRLWEEYSDIDSSTAYSYSQFTELFRRYERRNGYAMRMVHRAGEKMFVDYAGKPNNRPLLVNAATGETRRVEIFVAVLGASSYTYAEATLTQQVPDWIASNRRALEYFGGVPEMIVPDRLRSAVIGRDGHDPIINRTYQDFSRHYGTVIVPARARKPKDKAKAEVAVQVVQRWINAALRNHTFFTLAEINAQIRSLLEVLNNRHFKKRPGSRKSLFEVLDQPALKSLPETPFEYATWRSSVVVGPDYHIPIDGHYYSVPFSLIDSAVEARLTGTTVEIFCKRRRVASHIRSTEKGAFTTDPSHRPIAHQKYANLSSENLTTWGASIGEATRHIVAHLLTSKRHPQLGFKSCLTLQSLARQHGSDRLNAACHRAIDLNSLSVKTIRSLLSRSLEKEARESMPLKVLPSHENVRGSAYYAETEASNAS